MEIIKKRVTFTILLMPLLVMLAACPNGNDEDGLTEIPESAILTGYSDIKELKDNVITEQNPDLSELPPDITFIYSIDPPAPNGLELDPNTGVLSGVPTTGQEPEDYTITATAEKPYSGTISAEVSITIYKAQAADKADLITLIDQELAAADGNINLIDTSIVTDMSELFKNNETFNKDISIWDVSNVTDMSYMFSGAKAFNQDLSSWDVSNVTDMQHMFANATSFNGDVSSWNTAPASVTDMKFMFYGAASFNADISGWDTSRVMYMGDMFNKATSFNQDISDWNIDAVENMMRMFDEAASFNQDLEKWNVDSSVTTTDMFRNSGVIETPNWYW